MAWARLRWARWGCRWWIRGRRSEAAALLEELLGGWRRQQLARRLAASTIVGRERVVRQFVEFAQGWPWSWREEQLEAWVAAHSWAPPGCSPAASPAAR